MLTRWDKVVLAQIGLNMRRNACLTFSSTGFHKNKSHLKSIPVTNHTGTDSRKSSP